MWRRFWYVRNLFVRARADRPRAQAYCIATAIHVQEAGCPLEASSSRNEPPPPHTPRHCRAPNLPPADTSETGPDSERRVSTWVTTRREPHALRGRNDFTNQNSLPAHPHLPRTPDNRWRGQFPMSDEIWDFGPPNSDILPDETVEVLATLHTDVGRIV
ncbi:hypothetical protein BD626DRAFT_244713 [Schizophyllum amplum]|uniref:Uncharacterized protein n=1 Tax=Schizophyllum amplum TaxID=97359 RepID=A0A550BVY5_9AGAR|nr:hypothetical protein BD626DRAFT_244713 [Auriculariopsis ampla]